MFSPDDRGRRSRGTRDLVSCHVEGRRERESGSKILPRLHTGVGRVVLEWSRDPPGREGMREDLWKHLLWSPETPVVVKTHEEVSPRFEVRETLEL